MRIQRRIRGGRKHVGAAVHPSIRRIVRDTAERHDCSKSFVIATILMEHFGFAQQENYYDYTRKLRKVIG